VKQILLNLLSNAVKFTSEGRVIVRALPIENGRMVRIEVEDTGIGIKAEDQDSIFDDFRQVDQSSTRKYGGTGLGLSITRKLVRLMGGTVQVQSEFGQGSTFRVDLPAVVSPQSSPGDVFLPGPQDIVGM
jgi:signal transduction histidine kinase